MNQNGSPSPSFLTQRDIKRLLFKISRLSRDNHTIIFEMIKKSNINYTQNKNGVFLCLAGVPHSIISQIDAYVDTCLQSISDRDNGVISNGKEEKGSQDEKKYIDEQKISIGDDMNGNENENENGNDEDRELDHVPNWTDALNEHRDIEKVNTFVQHLEDSIENLHKKKGNIKYANAMKKYGRVYTNDKKFDPDVKNSLTFEEYIF